MKMDYKPMNKTAIYFKEVSCSIKKKEEKRYVIIVCNV